MRCFIFILMIFSVLLGKSTVSIATGIDYSVADVTMVAVQNGNTALDLSKLDNKADDSPAFTTLHLVLSVSVIIMLALAFLIYRHVKKIKDYNAHLEAQVNDLSHDLQRNLDALSQQVQMLQDQNKSLQEHKIAVEEKKQEVSQALSSKAMLTEEAEQESVSIAADKSQIILLIDDDNIMLDFMKSVFDKYFTVITASNGKDGLQLAQAEMPSLIVSDINMPCVTGFSLCQQLKEDEMTCHIPIILLTSEARYQNEGFACGADDFIEKPFNNQNILLKVHAFLENRRKIRAQMMHKNESKGFIMPESFNDTMLQKIFTYLNANFSKSDIDVSEVSEHVGLSRSQLWRKFKSATGQNISDYVLELRLQKAREMLMTGKYKVAEVAYDVGFTNSQYFSRSFSARFNEAPKDCIDKAKSMLVAAGE